MTAFRVFSGWDKRQAEAAEVFGFSVRQNASIDVVVVKVGIGQGTDRYGGGAELTTFRRVGVTAFTYIRFIVPWLCQFEGRALFADGCDQLCLGDVRELAEWDMQGKPVWVVKHPPLPQRPHRRARSWTSLMLLDCEKLERWTPEYVETASDDRLMRLQDFGDDQIGALPSEWNHLTGPDDAGAWEYRGTSDPRDLGPLQPRPDLKMLHWSYLSDPNGGSWIDRSGSTVWQEWRGRWRSNGRTPAA